MVNTYGFITERWRWDTSIFPDTGRRSFVLPVKKAVRAAEDLDDGVTAQVVLDLVDEVG